MIRTRTRRSLGALFAFGLAAAACWGDDDGAAEPAVEDTAPGAEATSAETDSTGVEDTSAETDSTGVEDTSAETDSTGVEDTSAETDSTEGEDTAPSVDPASIETDIGIDDTTIKIGMLADLSGAFAPLVTEIVETQKIYWDHVNEQGGIAGRQIELVIEDTGYDVATHVEKYHKIRNEVAIISQSTGSPHTAATADMLEEDDLIAIPVTWYSGWADPEFGKNVFEMYATDEIVNRVSLVGGVASGRPSPHRPARRVRRVPSPRRVAA